MSMRAIVAIAIAAMIAFAFAAWNISIQMTPPPTAATGASEPAPGGSGSVPETGSMPGAAGTGEVAAPPAANPGLQWSVPRRWTIDLAQGMRVATYLVPAASGQGECAVY